MKSFRMLLSLYLVLLLTIAIFTAVHAHAGDKPAGMSNTSDATFKKLLQQYVSHELARSPNPANRPAADTRINILDTLKRGDLTYVIATFAQLHPQPGCLGLLTMYVVDEPASAEVPGLQPIGFGVTTSCLSQKRPLFISWGSLRWNGLLMNTAFGRALPSIQAVRFVGSSRTTTIPLRSNSFLVLQSCRNIRLAQALASSGQTIFEERLARCYQGLVPAH